jgi:hypothetical protein
MPSLPTSESQDGRGTKHTIDAGEMGSRDDGDTTLNREGLLVKTDEELLADIRRSAREVRDVEYAIPIVGSMPLWQIQKLESYANALAIYCKLLRQRLEAQDPSIQHLRATLAEGE